MSSDNTPAVVMDRITKRFGDNVVLSEVSFDVFPGEVHALLGGNGAGKSTLMKVLMGVYPPDQGNMRVAGEAIRGGSINAHKARGIAMIFQELSLLPNLSVADNIWLGNELLKPGWRIDRRAIRTETRKLLAHYGFSIEAGAMVGDLPFAQRQIVEIVKAVSHGVKVLIMDEPTSSLTTLETEKLFALIEELKRRSIAIVYISHRLPEVIRISDRITILRDGRTIGPLVTSETGLRSITGLLSTSRGNGGSSATGEAARAIRTDAPPALEVRDLSTARKLKNISFSVRAGEVVGLAGLVGSGRSTLAKALAGLLKDTSGSIAIDSRPVPPHAPWACYRAGMGFVPEDRRLEGLVATHALAANIALPNLRRLTFGGRFGIVLRSKTAALFRQWRERLSIDARNAQQTAGELSGGNQQKIVFAKWLASDPRILILDEPTAGVDVSAKRDMRRTLRDIAATGVGVLLINSELDELTALSDRVMVIAGGQITRALETTPDEGELSAIIQADAAELKTRAK